MVMTYTHAKNQGHGSGGAKFRVKTNRWTDNNNNNNNERLTAFDPGQPG